MPCGAAVAGGAAAPAVPMRKTFSFFVLSNSGSSSRQVTLSRGALVAVGLLSLAALGTLSYFAFGYFRLQTTLADNRHLERRILVQADEIVEQRRQIQSFADTINSLKTKLVNLNTFEKKIRIIANIDTADEQENLFGVGGSMPEDLDSRLELKQKHTALLRDMHEQVEQLDLASTRQEAGFDALLNYLEGQRNLLASTPAIRPSKGWKTSAFGYRSSPFTGRREFHKGLDIANRKGSPILATADGVVKFAGTKGLLGKTIVIDHGHGMVSTYGHIHKALKKPGEEVKRGDIIAEMGNTGRSTGPHLHYEIHLNGIPVNPTKYILN